MGKVTGGPPESPARRAARIARVGARYGFGFVFRGRLSQRRNRTDTGRIGPRLRLSLEELGPTFAALGRFLSARGDLLPPDIAAELGRAAVSTNPVPFAEVRVILERELGNTVERLFVRFEEAPARVGPFTQAHRAVLPGERPALVVLDRPGIRRDLLAMRPVADVTRRRIGNSLPLDPALSVAEFTAYVNHHRDMYFAARISHRLRGMEGFPLRVPQTYRNYSTGRCATFEAPADPTVPNRDQYRKIAGALVRLAVSEGIFLADASPGRFAVDGLTGEIWLSDPTEVSALDSERLRGVAEVLAAVRRGDVDGVARALPLAGGSVPRDDAALRRELRETLGSLGGPLWEEHPLAVIRTRGLEALRRGGARLHTEVAQMAHSVVAAEGLSGKETRAAAEAADGLVSRYRDPAYVAARTARRLTQPDAFADYPRQIHALLDELKDGEVEVRFRHAGLDDLIGRVDVLANRLVFALLIAALIIGSSMLGIFVEGGLQLLGVSVFGLVGFVFAAVLGLLLLVGIVRSGRL
ncbi:MAG: ABC1 family protein [uncultured Rubrobacteraceae bacterium]|jgi:ubiquinone biosynthesis protein|uniref:ABC1 family protein n=1 Tax=uncultured Rubrobacteraceae bacterium TaxID=349277 RepID=A0A6J4P455_9ACTN|nr:MAG: ABC1 family protein [uncultured Rubrobacteraceae bacterium]